MTRASGCVVWFVTAGMLWLGASSVCPLGACQVPAIDRDVLDLLNHWRAPWLDVAMATLTWLGSIMVLLPAALILARHFWARGRTTAARLLPLAVGGAWLWAQLSKWLIDRPRPEFHPALIAMPADASFPSAHTMQIAAFALACLFAQHTARQPVWPLAIVATALVGVVALSRLYLQVHFPTDVAFGLIAGVGWVLGLRLLLGAQR
jgi:membrane-associated phospholipid phosphatase